MEENSHEFLAELDQLNSIGGLPPGNRASDADVLVEQGLDADKGQDGDTSDQGSRDGQKVVGAPALESLLDDHFFLVA